jgi:hypothetical protein
MRGFTYSHFKKHNLLFKDAIDLYPEVKLYVHQRGVKGGKAVQSYLRKNNLGLYNIENKRKGGRIGGHVSAENSRKLQRGPYFDLKMKSINGRKGGKASQIYFRNHNNHPFKSLTFKQRTRMAKKTAQTNRKNKSGCCHNAELHRKASAKGLASFLNKKNLIWKNTRFMSKQEMYVAQNILRQPTCNKNYNVLIDKYYIDFMPQKNDIEFKGWAVEFHPIVKWLKGFRRPEKNNIYSYFTHRRKVLDDNGFRKLPLIVITSLKRGIAYT